MIEDQNIPAEELTDASQQSTEENAQLLDSNQKSKDQKSETENMEVHKHPHHVTHKKKWTEYFLEFLMIFLAVTLGFIAENLREHFTEHKNAKILAQSLFEDVKKDTASLHSLIDFSNKKLNAGDSVFMIIHSARNTWNARSFYMNMAPMLTSLPFRSTDGTYTQMKTSGTLRYFHQSLVNIINAYAVQLKKTEYRDEVADKGEWILGTLNFDIMNLEVLSDIRFGKPLIHEMFIKIDNKEITDKFLNIIAMNKGFCFRSLQEYQEQLKVADKLIEALQKEYDLN